MENNDDIIMPNLGINIDPKIKEEENIKQPIEQPIMLNLDLEEELPKVEEKKIPKIEIDPTINPNIEHIEPKVQPQMQPQINPNINVEPRKEIKEDNIFGNNIQKPNMQINPNNIKQNIPQRPIQNMNIQPSNSNQKSIGLLFVWIILIILIGFTGFNTYTLLFNPDKNVKIKKLEDGIKRIENKVSDLETKQAEVDKKHEEQQKQKEQNNNNTNNQEPQDKTKENMIMVNGKNTLKEISKKYNTDSKQYLKNGQIDIAKIYKEFIENAEIAKQKEQGTWKISVASNSKTRLEFVFDNTQKGQQQPTFDVSTLKQEDNTGKERIILQFDNPNVKVFEVTIENNKEVEKEVN